MSFNRWKRYLLITVASFVLLATFLYFARPIYLPDSFLISQLEKQSTTAGFPLKIESGEIHLLHSMTLRGITLWDSTGLDIAHIKEAHLSYRPTSLLHRSFLIEQITLVEPQLKYFQDSRLNADTVLTAPQFTFDIPVTIEVQNAQIENASYHIMQILSDGAQIVYNGAEVNLSGKNIRIKNSHDFHAEVTWQEGDTLLFSYQTADFATFFSAPLSLSLGGIIDAKKCEIQLACNLSPNLALSFPDSNRSSFTLPASEFSGSIIIQPNWDIYVDSIYLNLGDEATMLASSRIEDTWVGGHLSFAVQKGHLNLQMLWDMLRQLTTLPVVAAALEGRELMGQLSLDGSEIKYNIWSLTPDFQIDLRYDLQDLNFRDQILNYAINELNSSGVVETALSPSAGFSYAVNSEINIKSLKYDLPEFQDIFVAPLSINLETGAKPGWKELYLKTTWQGVGPYYGRQNGSLSLTVDSLNFDNPAASPGLTLKGNAKLADLTLDSVLSGPVSGIVSADFDLLAHDLYNADVAMNLTGTDLKVKYQDREIQLPQLLLTSSAILACSQDFQKLRAQQMRLEAPPYGQLGLDVAFALDRTWSVDNFHLQLDLGVMHRAFGAFLPDTLRHLKLAGILSATGAASGEFSDSSLSLAHEIALKVEDLSLASPEFGFAADHIMGSSAINGDLDNLKVLADLSVGEVGFPAFAAQPYRNFQGHLSTQIRNRQTVDSLLLNIKAADLGLKCDLSGQFDLLPAPAGQCRLLISFNAPDSIQPIAKFWLQGQADGDLSVILKPDSNVAISGVINIANMALNYADSLSCQGLRAKLPFEMDLVLDSVMTFAPTPEIHQLTLEDPVIFAAFEHLFPPDKEGGTFSCEQLRFTEYEVSNLSGRASLYQGQFSIPQFVLNAYDGNLQGGLVLNLSALAPDSLQYNIRLMADGVDLARLPNMRSEKGEDTQISAFAHFRGQGINTEANFNLEGSLDITRIGRRVADNLLKFMDPDETDPSIQTYRSYLKRGWGVKVFSFAVKDDFVYASITPTRPSITQPDMFIISRMIGLGKSISFGRVPLKFFLTETPQAQP